MKYDARNKWTRIGYHLIFWIGVNLFFSLNGAMFPLYATNGWGISLGDALTVPWIMAIVDIPYAYCLTYFLIPRYLWTKKYWTFAGAIVVWMVIGILLNYLIRRWILFPLSGELSEYSFGKTVFAFSYFILLNATAFMLAFAKIAKSYFLVNQRVGLLQNERLMAELQLLKSQVHPHFLFNTLNNLQSLIIQRSDQAPEMAQRLHALTKYIMVECKKEEIPLQNEIAILRDYIGLQKVRYDERLSVAFQVHGDVDGLSISPLLLMPLLENSFKHGVSRQVNDCWIRLDIHCEKKGLCVQVSNSREETVRAEDYTGGIGLQNIRKRLDLLYEKDYDLAIVPEKDSFSVRLQLNHA